MAGNMSLKSSQQPRVDLATAQRIASERQSLGNGQFCPASAQDLFFDVYGRPASNTTLDKRDASCSNYMGRTGPTLQNFLAWEDFQRPLAAAPNCSPDSLTGDGMGVGRNLFPQNIYGGETNRGNFVNLMTNPSAGNRTEFSYIDKTLAPCDRGNLSYPHVTPNYFAQYKNGSMDALSVFYRG
jgi:hypothetical protein